MCISATKLQVYASQNWGIFTHSSIQRLRKGCPLACLVRENKYRSVVKLLLVIYYLQTRPVLKTILQKLASSNAHYVPALSILSPPRQRTRSVYNFCVSVKNDNKTVLVATILIKWVYHYVPAKVFIFPHGTRYTPYPTFVQARRTTE